MPYQIKGQCIYNRDTGKKMGCTKGNVQRYLRALYANVPDAKKQEIKKKIKEAIRSAIKRKSLISEEGDLKKSGVTLSSQLEQNQGLDFTSDEIKTIDSAIKGKVNSEIKGNRGQELNFSKEINNNNFYFVVKKLVNKNDDSETSFVYGVWYVEYNDTEELDKSTDVYYRLSNPIDALIKKSDGYDTDISKRTKYLSELTSFINKALKVNL